MASSSSSSSICMRQKHEVFLSFRGEDTRYNFTNYLYTALREKGIDTFIDNDLKRGDEISPALLKTIEESMISIVILSKNYASSSWCLDELSKIIECKEKYGQKVVPIFYHVDPSDVRKQTGSFAEARLTEKERRRAALTEVGNLAGWHLKNNRPESEFIQDIVEDVVKEISSKMSPTLTSVIKEFVGMDMRLEKLSLHIGVGLEAVRFVGIYGMGGIGKTTLANVVYRQLSCHFEGSSFLANVREVSQKDHLVSLQKQLLSEILMENSFSIPNGHHGINMIRSRLCRKRVLVIIDDVDHIDQLKKLAGSDDWFGLGSRIIITTRDKHLLNAHGVQIVYEVECLDQDEALQLFCLKAFKNDDPPNNYIELCERALKYTGGLPLALEVFGTFLFGRSIDEWESALERLQEDSGKEILDILQISFDGLEETEKKIFLDVACFFKGKDNDYVTKILDSCGFYPQIGIKRLIEKCLIVMSSNNKLWMHDLLVEMAKKIVQKESPKEPGKRSRLWDKEEVYHVLTKNLGTETVEVITHDFSEFEEVPLSAKAISKHEEMPLSAKAFSNMNTLRVLQIRNMKLPQGLDYLSNELCFLNWHGYPLKYLPSSFQLEKVVVLNLRYSYIRQLWKGMKLLNKLKFIDLSHSQNLIEMPDFTGIPNLENLILEGCTRLSKVHQSIGLLKRLILLNLKDCKSLCSLSSIIEWESLEVCILAGCSKLSNFPEIIGKMEFLKELDVSGTAIGQFPSSTLLSMKNLEVLSFRGCKGPSHKLWHLFAPFHSILRRDPMPLMLPSLSGLCSLRDLDLSDCNLSEGTIPNDFGCLSSLRTLRLNNNNFVTLPPSISQFSKLETLSLKYCKRLQSLLELPSSSNLFVKAEACSSLKTLSDRSDYSLNAYKCFQLMENQVYNNMALARIKRHLQGIHDQSNPIQSDRFDIIIPGGEIPYWISHQSEGSSISIERVPLVHNSKYSKLVGFALCSVFAVHEPPPVLDHCFYTQGLTCHPKFNGPNDVFCWAICGFYETLGQASSDHLWLLYLSRPSKYISAKGQVSGFSFISTGECLEVKKCGVRPVYEHDVEEFNQTRDDKCSSALFEKFNDLHQDFDGSTMNGGVIKRIHDDGDKAEPSGSDGFVEEP